MVKIKKEASMTTSLKDKEKFKKNSEKKKLKKLKVLVKSKNTKDNKLLNDALINQLPEKKKNKKTKDLEKGEKVTNNKVSDPVIPAKVSRKSKKNKVKVSENINPEIFNKFDITTADIKSVIKGLIKYRAENPKLQNQLFEEAAPLWLQISCHKVPKGIGKICRIPLKHSLFSPDDEICLIVPEVKGIRNIDHEKHIEHYEKMLKDKGVQNIKKIMTFHEFRTEYETFEQKNRLVDTYDAFLADGKISGKVIKKCGKIFYKKRKVPVAVKLQATKLKEHLDKILKRTFLNLHLKGNSYTIQFGHTNMQKRELMENFTSVLEFLDKEFPGGFENLQGLLIATLRAPSVSIYMSTKSANDLEVPKVVRNKPKASNTLKGEFTMLPDAQVVVKPSGQVIVKRKNDQKAEGKQKNKNVTVGKYIKLKTEDKKKIKSKPVKKLK